VFLSFTSLFIIGTALEVLTGEERGDKERRVSGGLKARAISIQK